MTSRRSNRLFSGTSIETWFRRLEHNWEPFFDPEELQRGRKLYRRGHIREVELQPDLAIVRVRIEDIEPYVVIEWENHRPAIRHSTRDGRFGRILAAAGLYEIEEIIAEETNPLAPDARPPTNGDSPEPSPPSFETPADRPAAPPPIRLHFSCVEDGLAFRAVWSHHSGIEEPVFGTAAAAADASLLRSRREGVIRLSSMARKVGFQLNDNVGYFLLEGSDRFLPFLQNGLKEWRKVFSITLDPEVQTLLRGVQNVTVVARTEPTAAGRFRLNWSLVLGDESLNRAEVQLLLKRRDRPTVLRQRGLIQLQGPQIEFLESVRNNAVESPRYSLFSLVEKPGIDLQLDPRLEAWRDGVQRSPDPLPDPPHFLRPYQRKGVEWLNHLTRHGCGALLADEMGLGKTLQVLSLLAAQAHPTLPSLVVCPASVIPVWKMEAEKFFPGLPIEVLSGSQNFNDQRQSLLWIASYTQLRRHRHLLPSTRFHFAILDEAQQIKNPDAKVSRACYSIEAERRIALSGTPIENTGFDLWSIFRFLMPGFLGSQSQFRELLPGRDKASTERLRLQIAPFLLRRTKKAVARELPSKVEMDIPCPMNEGQRKVYSRLCHEAVRRYGDPTTGIPSEDRMHILALFTRLRQICCDPSMAEAPESGVGHGMESGKTQLWLDRLPEILAGGHKIVVFSQFVRYLDRLKSALGDRFSSLPVFELTGQTRNREEPVRRFQEHRGAAVFLISLKAGGMGITLHAADYLFLMDPWWNPAVEQQAIDRVHRIGQERPVFVYRMVTQQSIEESVRQLQRDKSDIFQSVVGELDNAFDFRSHFDSLSHLLGIHRPSKPDPAPSFSS